MDRVLKQTPLAPKGSLDLGSGSHVCCFEGAVHLRTIMGRCVMQVSLGTSHA